MKKSAEIPDLVWGETKSVPCITFPFPVSHYKNPKQNTRSYRGGTPKGKIEIMEELDASDRCG